MKTLTLRFLFVFAALMMQQFYAAAQLTGNDSVCAGQNFTYTSSLSGTLTWNVVPAGATIVPAGNTAQITWSVPPGAYTVSVTDGNTTELLTVNVFAIPAPVLKYTKNPCSIPKDPNGGGGAGGPDEKCDSFCVNEVVTYTVANTPGNTYQWNFYPATGGTIISGQGTNSVMVTWAASSGGSQEGCRSLCLVETNPAGCSAQVCAHGVGAYLTSPITLVANPSYVCLRNTITFTGNTAGVYQNYTWDFGNGNIITTTPNFTSYVYPVSGTYTVIVTGNAKCCHESDTITVVVDSLPGPDIFCITPVCANTEGVQYCTGATNCTFSWVVTGGTIVGALPDSSCITIDWGAGPVGTISLTASNCNPALCPATTTVTVPIMPNGPFAITGPIAVCLGATASYAAPYVPGSQYTWTMIDPAAVSTILPYSTPPYIQNYTFTMMGTYTLKCHMKNDILECEGDGVITINVKDSMILLGPATGCADPVNPTYFSSYFSNFSPLNCDWTSSPNVGSFSNTSSAPFIFSSPGVYCITATETIPNTVCNSPKTICVTINASPATPVITGPTTVCPGGIYNYSVSGYSPSASVFWFLNEGVNFPSGNGTTFTGTFPAGFSSGTLTVTVTENGCSATTTININAPVAPQPVIALQNQSVCTDVSLNYTATLTYPGLSTVVWSISPSAAGTITVGQGTTSVTVVWNAGYPSATLQVVETTCLIQTGNDNLVVSFLPAPTPTATASSACGNGNTTLTATGGVSYNWFTAGGSSIGSGSSISTPYVAPGNYYVVATGANGCKAKAFTQAVILPEPTVQIFGPLSAACDPATGNFITPQTLQTFNGLGYTFNWSNGSTIFSTSVTQSGTYTVTVTNSSGCSKTQSWSIVCACGSPCPTCVDGGACSNTNVLNSPYTLTAPTGSSYLWSPGGQTTQSITTTTAGVLYSVAVTDNSNLACPTITYSYYLHCTGDVCPYSGGGGSCVANTPIVIQTNTYCNIVSFQTNTTGTCTGTATWTFGDGGIGSGNNPSHTYSQAGVYQVCYSIVNGPCDVVSACTNVTVPVAADFSSVVNCTTVQFSDLSTYLSPSSLTYLWNFGDPGNSTSTSSGPSFTYPGVGIYNVTLTVTVAGGCQAQVTIPVVINAPNISGSVQLTACNSPVQFTGIINGGSTNIVSWNWNFGDASSSNLQNPQHTYLPGTYTWIVTATDGFGCTAADTGTITVNAPPPPFNLTPVTSCGPAVVTAPAGYLSYQWLNNGSPIVPPATYQTYLATQSGNYSVNVTDANGCMIQSNPASVIINPIPPVALTVSPQPVCSTGTITVNPNTSGNVTVTWTTNVPNTPSYFGYNIQWSNVATGNYTASCVIVDNVTGCTSSGTISFTVNPSPSVFITNSNPGGVCSGIPITLTANASPVISYGWSNGNNTPAITVNSGGTYSVTVTNALGCTAVASTVAKINPLPDLQMLPIGCDSACDNPVVDTIIGPPGYASYDWQINGVSVSNLQNLGLNNINLPNYNVAYQIKLVATTINGCTDSTTFYYTPKNCDSVETHCVTLTDTIWCNTDGTYSFQIMVTNNNAVSSASIMLNNFTYPFTVNGMSYYYQFLNLPPNGNSGWLPSTPFILSGPTDIPLPETFCLHSIVIFGDTCCYDSLCFVLPNCDPCDNISVSTQSDATSCCQQISITNNFNGNYFSGVQVVPISLGATIASTTLGVGGAGWAAAGNASMMSFYPPGSGTIPLGTTTDLFALCLNLAIGAANPQTVLFNWFVPDVNGMDSIVCTDTLVFHCDPPLENPCGTIEDTIICLGDGNYQYTFTITNNSPNPINTAVIDWMSPIVNNFPLVFFYNPPIAPDSSVTKTFTFNTSLPVGSQICYHVTLLDSIGCCCHAVDTVCFTLPDCNVECACGTWQLFDVTISDPVIVINYPTVECGANFTDIPLNSYVNFNSGGFTCIGDASCNSAISWSVTGDASPTSGIGLPSFTVNSGTCVLTITSSCGTLACDTCTMTFITKPEEVCACGTWDLFQVKIDGGGSVTTTNAECNANVPNVPANSIITFISGGYTCLGDANCASNITWSVEGNATPLSGVGLPVFTIISGTCVVTLSSTCNGNKCDDCKITFITAEECNCGTWEPFNITTSSTSYTNQSCGGLYGSKPTFPITLSGAFDCIGGPNCSASYTWVINRNNLFFLSGTGLPITFTPSQTGTYTVTISALCNGQDCISCLFTFKVKNIGFAFGGDQPNIEDQQGFMGQQNIEGDVMMQIEPNPARELINVTVTSLVEEQGELVMYNELGMSLKIVEVQLKKGTSRFTWSAEELPAGAYTIRYRGATQSAISRVIVTR